MFEYDGNEPDSEQPNALPADAPSCAVGNSPTDDSSSTDLLPSYDDCPPDELSTTLDQLYCLEAASRLQYLRVIASLDRRQIWKDDSQASMANWLALRHNLRRSTARQQVRIAVAIEQLPHLADAYGTGRISFDQLDALTQLADTESDAQWAIDGPRHDAETLHTMARRRRIEEQSARDAHANRGLNFRPDPKNPASTRISGQVESSVAEQVAKTLDGIASRTATRDPLTDAYPTQAQQRADALGLLAGAQIPDDITLQPATVVVHGDIGLLTGEDPHGHATVADGNPIAAQVFQRLTCDGLIEWTVDGPDGATLGIGRASRTWPAWLVRHIRRRDADRCRFPGCNNHIHHIHHIAEWTADLGDTSNVNGVGLCYRHHREVHEGGWTVTGNAEGTLTFTSPYGRPLTSVVPRLDPEVERRMRRLHPRLFEPSGAPTEHAPGGGTDAETPDAGTAEGGIPDDDMAGGAVADGDIGDIGDGDRPQPP